MPRNHGCFLPVGADGTPYWRKGGAQSRCYWQRDAQVFILILQAPIASPNVAKGFHEHGRTGVPVITSIAEGSRHER
mgnify:FL=1|jgi:hypothetical protein|uniref:Uncharacterized protein n=1 Tax=Ralstonia pickettii (strain 12D) TaxID=428406 RepID=C6BGM9_RALP1